MTGIGTAEPGWEPGRRHGLILKKKNSGDKSGRSQKNTPPRSQKKETRPDSGCVLARFKVCLLMVAMVVKRFRDKLYGDA